VRAGVDVIADGEMRRQDFIMSFYDRLAGLRAVEPARKIGVPLYDRMTVYETVDRITAPPASASWTSSASPTRAPTAR